MTTRVLRMTLAVLAALVLTAPLAGAVALTPFRSEFAIEATFIPTATPGVLAGTTSGAGRATHLGRVTTSTTETLDFTASATGAALIREGLMTMVAANGDELHWAYSGTASAPGATGDVDLGGTFTVTGGTGRFATATGGGTFTGSASVVTGLGLLSYQGTIRR